MRLHHSYASRGNFAVNSEFADVLAKRSYQRSVFTSKAYTGTHSGIVPEALIDGIRFALANP